MPKNICLFEYGAWETFDTKDASKQFETLNNFLTSIWQSTKENFNSDNYETGNSAFNTFYQNTNNKNELSESELTNQKSAFYQPFLKFKEHKNTLHIRANNYVGFIQQDDTLIEIYPKVFKNIFESENKTINTTNKVLMLKHIFYWLSYSRRWKFPFNDINLDALELDSFPELLMYLFARQFYTTVSKQPLSMYQEVEEASSIPKGRINFKRYITNSLATGNFQNLEYDYEPFVFDNNINRCIKYCTRLLLQQSKQVETQRLLQETLFILDEVEDTYITSSFVNTIKINRFFEEYILVLDSCKLILNQQLYANQSADLSTWALLLPTEILFEDLVLGFIEKHYSDTYKIESQKSDMYLANYHDLLEGQNHKVFNLQHDIFLTHNKTKKQIILDTKYKLRNLHALAHGSDYYKRGISQTDLYQMLSYAYRRGLDKIVLIYPNSQDQLSINSNINFDHFIINTKFKDSPKIHIIAMDIPFWTMDNANDNFDLLKKRLKESLNSLWANLANASSPNS